MVYPVEQRGERTRVTSEGQKPKVKLLVRRAKEETAARTDRGDDIGSEDNEEA